MYESRGNKIRRRTEEVAVVRIRVFQSFYNPREIQWTKKISVEMINKLKKEIIMINNPKKESIRISINGMNKLGSTIQKKN